MSTRRRSTESEERRKNKRFLNGESQGEARVLQGHVLTVSASNLDARISGLKKLSGKTIIVGELGTGFDPRKHPNCLYVPLPEYGLYLLHEYPTESKETK